MGRGVRIWIENSELRSHGMEATDKGLLINLSLSWRRDVLKLLRRIVRTVATPQQWEKVNDDC